MEIKLESRPWKPQDLIDDLQEMIDEQPDNYLNTSRTTLCTARDYLKDFFAIGLEPSEIAALQSKFSVQNMCRAGLTDGIPLDRLEAICEAERDNRLIVLPCKVGDTIYDIFEILDIGEGDIREIKVKDIYIHIDKRGKQWFVIDGHYFSTDDFGKNAFFTYETAAAALKEDEG